MCGDICEGKEGGSLPCRMPFPGNIYASEMRGQMDRCRSSANVNVVGLFPTKMTYRWNMSIILEDDALISAGCRKKLTDR
jgi:hypothetical protein